MSFLKTFISEDFRPVIQGARLDASHKTHCFLDPLCVNAPWLAVKAVCFGPKQDKVLLNLEHAITSQEDILFLYYEDIHRRWSFVRTEESAYFLFQKNNTESYRIHPKRLYIRGCQIDMEDERWIVLGEFYNFIDTWEGEVLCAPKHQINNESKLYQLSYSLKPATNNRPCLSIGSSFVLKGKNALKKLSSEKSYIVKSLSGVRSKVVDESHFSTWSLETLNNLPVLFQEKVVGNDLRIHLLNGNLYGKFSTEKTGIDYRYDDNFFTLQEYADFSEDLKKFCRDVSRIEENAFLGIDFIKTAKGYVVLEANPSPGWSAYYVCDGIENTNFVQDLVDTLMHG